MNPLSTSSDRQSFVRFALDEGVLRFGQFETKSGRLSPYFFNAGLFNTGASVGRLGQFYAQTLLSSGLSFDMLFGPAYKGIPLATCAAIALSQDQRCRQSVPFAFNRKEAKTHGEGGALVGAPLQGKVVIVDDVITAGTSVRESVDIIRAQGAEPVGVLIAMDRMERASGPDGVLSEHSAVQEVTQRYGMPVISIANLTDILAWLATDDTFKVHEAAVKAYRDRYGL